MKRTIRILVLLCLSFTVQSTFAQSPSSCATGSNCTAWSFNRLYTAFHGCQLEVDFWCRVCDGVLQYQYSNLTYTGTDCNFWKDSTLQQVADLEIIRYAISSSNTPLGCGTYSVPDCPSTAQQVEFITTACYIWQDCQYATNQAPFACFPPDNIPLAPSSGHVDVWTWHDCGTACCKRVYNVCVDNAIGDYGSSDFDIEVSVVSRTIVGSCSGQTSWPDQTCNTGC